MVGQEMKAIILGFFADRPRTFRSYAAKMVMRQPGSDCASCSGLAKVMDELGADGCDQLRCEIVDQMYRNAVRFSVFSLAVFAENQIKSQLHEWLNLAIRRARES